MGWDILLKLQAFASLHTEGLTQSPAALSVLRPLGLFRSAKPEGPNPEVLAVGWTFFGAI